MGKLYFGDNLNMLREHVKDESVDLVYLDPPFNSKAQYNLLFKSPIGDASEAQAEAFMDSWSWGLAAEAAFAEVIAEGGGPARLLSALHSSMGESDMMAYLVMMTARLIELRRVLKPTGSLYLHCDPTASHYLKVMMDGVFGPEAYRAEISWKRQSAHNDAKQGRRQYGNIRDVILFYTRSKAWTWNWLYTPYSSDYVRDFYKHVEPGSGRIYRLADMTGPGGAAKGNPRFELLGVTRYWRYSRERAAAMLAEGRIVQTSPGTVPQQKRYLDEMPGVALQNDWSDISIASKKERLGYPTQKPAALLERIIAASSNEGDLVLDPFCGCGTTVRAAEKLKRQWVGMDITHYAVTLIEDKLKAEFPGATCFVEGRPADLAGARDLARRDKYQFQWWANWLFGVDQYRERKKGADRGIDGERFFLNGPRGVGRIVISVKGGEHVGVEAVRDLRAVLEREKAELGVLVTLAGHTRPMVTEAAAAGFVQTAHGQFPRLQLVAVSDLFAGRRPTLPVRAPFEQLKAAVPRAKKASDRQLAFTFAIEGGKVDASTGDVVFLDPMLALSAR